MNNFEYYFNYISINVKSHFIKMTIQLNHTYNTEENSSDTLWEEGFGIKED